MSDFIENLTSLTDNLEDIVFTRYATITNINTDGTVNCKEETGTLHNNVINTTRFNLSIDDLVLIGFVDNDIYQPFITGGVTIQNPDDTTLSTWESLTITDGVTLNYNEDLRLAEILISLTESFSTSSILCTFTDCLAESGLLYETTIPYQDSNIRLQLLSDGVTNTLTVYDINGGTYSNMFIGANILYHY